MMEFTLIRAAQLVLGSTLVIAGLAKQRINTQRAVGLAVTGLVKRIRGSTSLTSISRFWRTVGVAEAMTGLALIVPASSHEAVFVACSFLVIGLGYLVIARRLSPGQPCGCFGTGGRITTMTIVRCMYVLTWAIFLEVRSVSRSSEHTSAFVVAAFAAAIVAPIVMSSLAWRDIKRTTCARWSELQRFIRARVALPLAELRRIETSDVWHAMACEVGADTQRLEALDTWMEGNWRIWELRASRSSGDLHLIAGRYLGTNSRWTRLMLFEGPVEQGKYVGSWDSRLVGSGVL